MEKQRRGLSLTAYISALRFQSTICKSPDYPGDGGVLLMLKEEWASYARRRARLVEVALLLYVGRLKGSKIGL